MESTSSYLPPLEHRVLQYGTGAELLPMRPTRKAFILIALAILAGSGTSFAQTTVTTNGTSGDWTNGGTWTGGVVPNNGSGNTYNVQILNTPNNVTVALNTAITVNDLQLQSGSTLNTLSGATLTLSSLENDGTFNTGIGGAGGNTATISGDVTNNGSLTLFGEHDTLNVSGTFTNNGALSVFGTGDVVNINTLNNGATGSLTISLNSLGTINLTGGGLGITDIASTSSVDIGGTFNLINGSTTTSGLANLTSVEGSLILRNGQITSVTPNGTDTLTFAVGSLVDISNNSTLQVNGNLTNNGSVRLGFYGGMTDALDVTGTLTNNGMIQLLDGVGDPILAGSLNNTGALTIGTGDALILTATGITDIVAGSSLDVQGDLLFQSGGVGPTSSALANLTTIEGALTLENGETTAITPTTGTLAIASTGAVALGGSHTMVNLTGDVSNMGSLIVADGGNALNISGNVLNSGNVMAGQGSTLGIAGAYQQTAGGTTTVAGTLSATSFTQSGGTTIVQSGGTLLAPTVQVTGGSMQGGGTIQGNLSLTGGFLLPGTPAGTDTLSVIGDYTQGPLGTLVIDFDGQAGDYSLLSISGAANLGGALDFTSLDGFAPTIGDEFTFLTFGSFTGDFSSVVFTNFACPVGAVCEEVFSANSLTLEILPEQSVPTPEPGSFLLLGSGLLACCGYLRKRSRA